MGYIDLRDVIALFEFNLVNAREYALWLGPGIGVG